MRTILLLAALSGKLDDPAPRAPATAPVATHKLDDPKGWPPRDLPVAMRPPEPEPTLEPEPQPEPRPPAKPDPLPVAPKAQLPKPPAMPAPQIHYRKDVTGKTWYHTDPRWLETYVGRINASQVPRYYFPSYQFSGSACAGGSCPR